VSRFVKRKPFDESKVFYVQRVEAQAVVQSSGGDQGIGNVEPVAQGISFKQRQKLRGYFSVNGNLMQARKMLFDLEQFPPIPGAEVQFANGDHAYRDIGQANLGKALTASWLSL
jgi:hypothetical protein